MFLSEPCQLDLDKDLTPVPELFHNLHMPDPEKYALPIIPSSKGRLVN